MIEASPQRRRRCRTLFRCNGNAQAAIAASSPALTGLARSPVRVHFGRDTTSGSAKIGHILGGTIELAEVVS
jgi:hypothetical protein